jgi:hypothetical protein
LRPLVQLYGSLSMERLARGERKKCDIILCNYFRLSLYKLVLWNLYLPELEILRVWKM